MAETGKTWPARKYHDILTENTLHDQRVTQVLTRQLSVNQQPSQRHGGKGKTGGANSQVLGSTRLVENGQIQLIPMPTPNPQDPLNLPVWRKWTAIVVLCFFGSLGLAAEIVIAMLLPVFILEYSGVDPTTVLKNTDLAAKGPDPLAIVPPGVKPVSLMQISLLATIPQIANGVAGYFLIPLSTAIGRRPVLLATAVAAWAGGFWAGASTSLQSHIAARVVHGLGAGAVEALLPLIVQDMVFIHQRAKATAAVISSQGVFIVILGVLAPYLSVTSTWRWVYWITSSLGLVAWVLIIIFVPETRWVRSKEELSGKKLYPLRKGENRPRLDPATYGVRTLWTNIGVFQFGFEWKRAGISILDALRTVLFPAVIYSTLSSSAFFIITSATGQAISFALLNAGIPFEWTGISVIPSIIATVAVYFFGGVIADKVALFMTKLNNGRREPEHHLPNFVLPFITGIAGCLIFGVAAQNNLHFTLLLLGSFFILFGSLTLLTATHVFIVESYPQWAGPVLVNVSSWRIIITFFVSTNVTTWLQQIGPLRLFVGFSEMLIVVSLGIPLLFFTGKRIRRFTGGKVKDRVTPKDLYEQETDLTEDKV